MKKQSFLQGSAILLLSAILTKAVGACFKLPLTNLLGGTGMGYFGCAYGLFLPVYALSVTGLTTAVARCTAEHAAFGQYRTVRRILRLSLLCFACLGAAGSLANLLLAKPFSRYVIANPDALLSVMVLAPAVLLGCIAAVFRGYYEGLRNMLPTACSQLAEAPVKLVCGLWFCSAALRHSEQLLPHLPAGTSPLAAAAAAAVLGVTVSTLAGTLFLIGVHLLRGDGITRAQLCSDRTVMPRRALLRELFRVLVPVAAGSLVTNLTSLIDLATGMHCLRIAVNRAPELFARQFPQSAGSGTDGLANFIFGSFTGLAVTLFNLVPSITNMLGKSAIPALTTAHAAGDRTALRRDSIAVLRVTGFLAIPAGLGIAALAPQILRFLFPARTEEILASVFSLRMLGLGVIFLACSFSLFCMLQAVGKADCPVRLMLIGVAVKLLGNLLLIPLPALHIGGAAIATTLCYGVIFVLSLRAYCRATAIRLPLSSLFLSPAYAGLLCAATALLADSLLWNRIGERPALPIAICCGGGMYLLAMRLLGIRLSEREKSPCIPRHNAL